jgi:hypothetical protein
VGPLPAEGDDDRQDPLCRIDGLAGEAALERRREELHDAVVQRVLSVGLVAEVGGEHQERVSRVAHHRLRHQAEVADARGVGGDRRAVRRLERGHRGVELRGAADAADARGDDERVLGIAAHEDLLEAAEHRPDTPRVGDRVAVELQPYLHVALDPVEVHPDRPALRRHPGAPWRMAAGGA